MRNIELIVNERPKCVQGSREHHPGFTKERLIAWRAELWEILRIFDVCVRRLTMPTISELPQGEVVMVNVHEVNGIKQRLQEPIDTNSSAPVYRTVGYCFYLYTPFLADHLLDVGYVSAFH